MAYALFGGAVLLISIPVVAMFLQNDPSDLGLEADGAENAMSAVELMAYLVSRYFGLRSFATAYGYAFPAFMLAEPWVRC